MVTKIHPNGVSENGTTKTNGGKSIEDVAAAVIEHLLKEGAARDDELEIFADGDRSLLNRTTKKLSGARAITKRNNVDSDGNDASEWTFMDPNKWRGHGPDFIMAELFEKKERGLKYKNYTDIDITIRLISPSLAPFPRAADMTQLVFRRIGGQIWLQPGYFRAALVEAARMIKTDSGVSAQQVFNEWCSVADTFIDVAPLIVPPATGLPMERTTAPEGKGFLYHESLPAGTQITFTVAYPDALSANDVRKVAIAAGKYVGYSPAKHKMGWGRFRVLDDANA